jgi:hypothetical protein
VLLGRLRSVTVKKSIGISNINDFCAALRPIGRESLRRARRSVFFFYFLNRPK